MSQSNAETEEMMEQYENKLDEHINNVENPGSLEFKLEQNPVFNSTDPVDKQQQDRQKFMEKLMALPEADRMKFLENIAQLKSAQSEGKQKQLETTTPLSREDLLKKLYEKKMASRVQRMSLNQKKQLQEKAKNALAKATQETKQNVSENDKSSDKSDGDDDDDNNETVQTEQTEQTTEPNTSGLTKRQKKRLRQKLSKSQVMKHQNNEFTNSNSS